MLWRSQRRKPGVISGEKWLNISELIPDYNETFLIKLA